MKNKKSLRIAVVLFVMVFAVGAAFAATNGMLAFGGTVRINTATVTPGELRLEMVETRVNHRNAQDYLTATSQIVYTSEGLQTLSFDLEIFDTSRLPANQGTPLLTIDVQIRNTGDVPARIINYRPTDEMMDEIFGRLFTFSGRGSTVGTIVEPGEEISLTLNLMKSGAQSDNQFFDAISEISESMTLTYAMRLNYEKAQ